MVILSGFWIVIVLSSTFFLLPSFKVGHNEKIPDLSQKLRARHQDIYSTLIHQSTEASFVSLTKLPGNLNTVDANTARNPKSNCNTQDHNHLPLDPKALTSYSTSHSEGNWELSKRMGKEENVKRENRTESVEVPQQGLLREMKQDENSLKECILSGNYLLYLLWYTVLYIRIQTFVGFFNPWISEVVDNNINRGIVQTVIYYSETHSFISVVNRILFVNDSHVIFPVERTWYA